MSSASSTSSTSTTSSPINVVNFLGTAPPMARTYHVYKPHPPSPPPALSLSQSTILVAEDESLTQLSNSVRAAATTGSDADDDRTIFIEEDTQEGTQEGSTREGMDTLITTSTTDERTASPPPELSDLEWTEAFSESLGSAQILNEFLGRVPFVVWTSLSTSWLMIAVHRFGTASKEEASLEFMVDTPATLEALALISVLRGRGADWPKNMSESDACWWRCRLAGFQEAKRIMTHEGKNEAKNNYDSSSNGSGSNDGFLHKRARLDDAEEEEGGERTKFP